MGTPSTYVTAVVAGAITAGLGAANAVAVHEPDESVAIAEADLAAVTIPIIDFDETVGPLTVWRELAIQAGTNPLLLGLIQNAGNTYDLPGLTTTVDSNTNWLVQAVRQPGEYIDFGWDSARGQLGSWGLLGIASGSDATDTSRSIHFKPLLGGSGGIGASLYGTLADASVTRNLSLFDSGVNVVGQRTVGDFNGELALMPFDGFKVVGEGTAIDANPDVDFNLGSLAGSAGGHGNLSGDVGLCLGSAQASCGGRTAFLTVGAPVSGGLQLGGTNIISGDFSTNKVVAELKDGQLSVEGAIGGTVKVGSISIGRPIPIDIQIPRTASTTSSSSNRQTQTVRDSFMAVPRKSASDNETGGRHHAPLREAATDIKAAVDNAVSGKHAAKEADD
ncbi:hypothetical protein [Mycolicibacterium stellerae]|uniref:hypothetical protein n=1 Tax=Mycolicibacterium stellerae TaxID=2358193 RepID=UPI000F0BBED5|nr:hypothetical protein [Mycolicibacterium stellerae]